MKGKISIVYIDPHELEQIEDPFEMGLDMDGDWKGFSEAFDSGKIWTPWWAEESVRIPRE